MTGFLKNKWIKKIFQKYNKTLNILVDKYTQ
jgi:hypothetical protein